MEGDHLRHIVAVLAAQVAQQLATFTDLGQPCRIVVEALVQVAQLTARLVELGRQRRHPLLQVVEGRPAAERAERRAQGVAGPPSALIAW